MDLIIIHLTDLHIKGESFLSQQKIDSIQKIINSKKHSNVLFIVSGDITDKGQETQFATCQVFFELLKEGIDSNFSVYFSFCPGNHDCFYNATKPSYRLQTALKANEENFSEIIGCRLPLFSNYSDFLGSFDGYKVQNHNELLSEILLIINGVSISVFNLNNSILSTCNDDSYDQDCRINNCDSGNLFIKRSYLTPIEKSPADIIILNMHAPIYYFCDDTQNRLKEILQFKTAVVFSGHIHDCQKVIMKDEACFVSCVVSKPFGDKDGQSFFCLVDLEKNMLFNYQYANHIFLEAGIETFPSLVEPHYNKINMMLETDFVKEIECNELLKSNIKIDDYFVFPLIEEQAKTRAPNPMKTQISDIQSFELEREKTSILCIKGENSCGKTTLLRWLFLHYFRNGLLPILLDGDQIRKTKNINKVIKTALLSQYDNKDAFDRMSQIDKEKVIILVDDFEVPSKDELLSLISFSNSIIFTHNNETRFLPDVREYIEGNSIKRLSIEPFYTNKRKELAKKLYVSFSKNTSDVIQISESQFVNGVEEYLAKLDKFENLDPASLIFLIKELFSKSFSYDSSSFSSLFESRLNITLSNSIKSLSPNYDFDTIKRIVGKAAYIIYIDKKMAFSSELLESQIKRENEIYGDSKIRVSKLIEVLLDARILKRDDDGRYIFNSREILAYFVAHECTEAYSSEDKDDTKLITIFSSDYYVPLNFLILMSISTSLKSETIPARMVEEITKRVVSQNCIEEQKLLKFVIGNEEIKQLESLTEDDTKKIDEKIARDEESSRKKYLRNKNNYYYFGEEDKDIRDIEDWLSRLKISAVLMDRFSSRLRKDKKDKLIKNLIRLPNIIIEKFHNVIFSKLDELFINVKNDKSGTVSSDAISKLSDFIVDIKRAFILYVYSVGSSCFNNSSSVSMLHDALESVEENQELVKVQELMLLSFSRKTNKFIDSVKPFLHVKSKASYFLKTSAFIIARNYCIRNRQDVMNNHRDLWELIVRKEPSVLFEKEVSKKR